jgi:hypothetical protein
MDIAIREGWAVMKDVGRRSGTLKGALIKTQVFPKLQPVRLGLGQVGLHGKRGLGDIEGMFVFSHFSSKNPDLKRESLTKRLGNVERKLFLKPSKFRKVCCGENF